MASFDVLVQNFYKVTQGNHEKVPYFTTKLEGTLNQIQLKCPRRIVDCKVACHLKDWLFHGVCKHIRDSIRYLHSNPETTYSHLMVAARKAESKMEDAKEKVRTRSSAATEVTDGSKELGDQIDQANGCSKQSRTGHSPYNHSKQSQAQGSWERADRQEYSCLTPAPTMVRLGLGQNTSTCSSSAASRVATASQGRGSTQALTGAQGNAQNVKDSSALLMLQMPGLGPYG